MNIRELTALTGIAERQVRYLIAEGFMPGPRGGRAHAEYDQDHVLTIQRYTRLHDLGFPPSAIKLLSKDTSSKAKAIRVVIEGIVPEKATRRDIKRLMALCRKVSVYYRVDLRDAITA